MKKGNAVGEVGLCQTLKVGRKYTKRMVYKYEPYH